ncbi:hypothetical protein Btru_056313 [Bulinus truncatus]|nr:hypothetical protein Btru_056313 [Bulinus truncatus]
MALISESHPMVPATCLSIRLPVVRCHNIANLTVSVQPKVHMDVPYQSLVRDTWTKERRFIYDAMLQAVPEFPDEIDWFKGGDKIDSTKYRHVTIDKYQSMADRSFISELIIDHSSLSDTGDYICRSSTDDIANLRVTVLHAESPNKRRGTNQSVHESEKSARSHENGAAHFHASKISLLLTLIVYVCTGQKSPVGLIS